MQLERVASSAVVGLASGIGEKAIPAQTVGGQTLNGGLMVEGAALIIGIGMQQFSKFTAPNIVDGVVDGAIALLARRGGDYVATTAKLGSASAFALPFRAAPMAFGAAASPMALGSGYAHRVSPSIGALRGAPRFQLT